MIWHSQRVSHNEGLVSSFDLQQQPSRVQVLVGITERWHELLIDPEGEFTNCLKNVNNGQIYEYNY